MKTLFFKPDGGWSGDYIPFHDGHTFRLFYLLDKRTPGGHRDGIDWACVETNDFIQMTQDYVQYIKDMPNDGNVVDAAYNAGWSQVVRYQGIPPFPETEAYVKRIRDRAPTYQCQSRS